MKVFRQPLYSFLVAAHPVLALLAANLGQTRPGESLRSLTAAVLIAGVALLLLRLLTSDWSRAAFQAGLFLLAFFSYGHVYSSARVLAGPEFLLARHRALIPIYGLVMLAGTAWSRRRQEWSSVNMGLNLIGLSVLAVPILQIASFQIELARSPEAQTFHEAVTAPRPIGELPDVYLIILDGYTRADVLRDSFGVNNEPFLTKLRGQGFEVFECSRSNYSQTELTLASSLNASYLEELPVELTPERRSRTELLFMIQDNRVRRLFETAGYRVYAFETGYPWSEWRDADVYLQPGGRSPFRLNGFEVLLLEGTAVRAAADAQAVLPQAFGDWQRDPLRSHRERVEYALHVLPDLAGGPGPKLVFAHLVIPHRPYLFAPPEGWAEENGYLDPDGGDPGVGEYEIGYRRQVLYLNYVLPDILHEIKSSSEPPPIILLMGDHGADDAPPEERSPILHALSLPGADLSEVPDSLTPVNSVRLVLNRALGLELPLLEDRSQYSSYERPFDLRMLDDPCEALGSP